jgi:putative endonuclease
MTRKQIGEKGEELAREYLLQEGYKICDVNKTYKDCEIDVVAKKSNTQVFVEVKTMLESKYGEPEEQLTEKKLKKLILSAQRYIAEGYLADYVRIDAMCIILDRKNSNHPIRITHYKDITSEL